MSLEGGGLRGAAAPLPRPLRPLAPLVAEHISAPLARLRRRCRLYLALGGLVRLVAALVLAGGVQLLLDRTLRLTLDQRAVLNVLITLVWLWVIYRGLLSPLLVPLPDRLLASVVDRAHPHLHDRIASAVQFAAEPHRPGNGCSPQLVEAVVREACRAAPGVCFLSVLNHRLAGRRILVLGGLAGLIAGCWILERELMATWFLRNWLVQEIPWPQRTYLRPIGFDAEGRRRVPRGEELEIAAEISGTPPRSAALSWQSASGRRGREKMTLVGRKRFEASLGVLTEDLRFRIAGGDELTREYVVEAVERPRVLRTVTRITPPEYTGAEPSVLEQQTALEVLEGSRLEIEADLNKPVCWAALLGAGGPAGVCELPAGERLRVRWEEPVSGTYSLQLRDADGLEDRRPLRFTIKVVGDAPPLVRMRVPGVGEAITPLAELTIELTFADTYGLGSALLYAQRGEDPPLALAVQGFRVREREFQTTMRLAVETLRVSAGQRLRLWAEAADLDPRGPNVGRTEPVTLSVVSREEFLSELARRELELRREFEQLISAQRGLKDGLERLLPDLPAGTPPTPLAQRLGALARRQETHASRALAIARNFVQLLEQMYTSKTAGLEDEKRILERVAAPLERLGRQRMPAASEKISGLRREAGPEAVQTTLADQDDLLREMRAILANMLEWEGYRDVVALLREVLSRQEDVHAATLRALEQELEAILGGPPAPAPQNPEAEKP